MSSPSDSMSRHFVVALTGASGTAYGIRLIQVLLQAGQHVDLVVSEAARQVALREINDTLPELAANKDTWVSFLNSALTQGPSADWQIKPITVPEDAGLACYGVRDYSAGIASGSFLTGGMVICPCSMGTLSSIASGASTNLIQRAADVHLKERRPLVIVPRETPLGLLGLENMVRVTQAGATVMPAMPGFYQTPRRIGDLVDFIVARICDHLGVPHQLVPRWGKDDAISDGGVAD